MIAFAVQMNRPKDFEAFERWCAPGLRLVMADDDEIVVVQSDVSVAHGYNQVLEAMQGRDLEALVFVHPDVELQDPEFRARLLRVLYLYDDAAIIGPIGARNVTSLAWWEGQGFGHVKHEEGGVYFCRGIVPVDALDGQLMAFSPWAIGALRFDETYQGGEPGDFVAHAHDVDICFRARAAGKRVLVMDTDVQHHTHGGYGNKAVWSRCNEQFLAKWILTPDGDSR